MRPGTEALAARTPEDLAPVLHLHVWDPEDGDIVSETHETRDELLHLFEADFEEVAQENGEFPAYESDPLIEHAVHAYLRDAGESHLLDEQEESDLLFLSSWGNETARNKLIMSNLRMVVYIARRKLGRGVDFEDLIQEGNVGLIEGVDRFDSANPNRLKSYVTYGIRSAMIHLIADQSRTVRVPAHVLTDINKWKEAENDLSQKTDSRPDPEQIRIHAGMNLEMETVRKALNIVDQPSLQATYAAAGRYDSERATEPVDPKAEKPGAAMEKADDIRFLSVSLGKLFDRQQKVIRLRYGLDDNNPRTLDETARILGISRESVRLDQVEAIKRLQEFAGVELPGDSL